MSVALLVKDFHRPDSFEGRSCSLSGPVKPRLQNDWQHDIMGRIVSGCLIAIYFSVLRFQRRACGVSSATTPTSSYHDVAIHIIADCHDHKILMF